jgi:hypothetical protein
MESRPVAVLDAPTTFPQPPVSAAREVVAWVGRLDARWPLCALALAALVVHASAFSGWLIDDAGITFAYARNLGHGYGLVSQPGVAPVEGYSNALWTALLAPLFTLRLFDPVWTPKLMSLALLVGALVLVVRQGRMAWLAVVPAALLALDTSFVVWGVSGLENPLLAFLLVVSATLALRDASADEPRYEREAAIAAALLAMTRPDAVLYAAAYPAVLLLARRRFRRLRYTASFGVVFATFLLARRVYFGDWVPNTFYAKVRSDMLGIELWRARDLAESALGALALPALALVAVAVVIGLWRREGAGRVTVLGVYLGIASAAYLALPPDWMPEYRFATGFFVFLYWGLAETLAWLWSLSPRRVSRAIVAAAALAVVATSGHVHAARTRDFQENPTVPFARIEEFARGYNGLSIALGSEPHSLLTPDLGGMLYDSHLRIYDLAGLCDRTVAHTLMGQSAVFREYVLANVRPTFIHFHGNWGGTASLHDDERFLRDYVPVYEQWQRPEGAEEVPTEPWTGDYVRREALASPHDLPRLQAEFHRLGLDRPLP